VANARAVILPFILIPSEIPLTYFEVLSLGTTIISTSNGGTTEYLNEAIFVSKRNEKSLSQMILKVSKEDLLVNNKKINAKLKMQNHLTWNEVGEKWLSLL
jgi:glycosyltransferase involved in cell wall biosynthesis